MRESTFAKKLLLWIPERFGMAVRLFRNNSGMAWTGDVTRLADGSLHIVNPRPLRAGLCEGSSDYIGWRSLIITQEMVGRKIAQFVAVETKKDGNAKRSKEQVNFVATVNDDGGVGVFASNNQEVEMALNGED